MAEKSGLVEKELVRAWLKDRDIDLGIAQDIEFHRPDLGKWELAWKETVSREYLENDPSRVLHVIEKEMKKVEIKLLREWIEKEGWPVIVNSYKIFIYEDYDRGVVTFCGALR